MRKLDLVPRKSPASLTEVARTVPEMFLQRAAASGEQLAWKQKRAGRWVDTSWAEFHRAASAVATYLCAQELALGDTVTIVGGTRGEWCVCDLGGQLAGAVTVGAYPTLTGEQLAYVLEHSDTRVVFVEDREQLAKVLAHRDRLPGLRRIVVWDTSGLEPAELAAVASLADVLATRPEPARLDARIAEVDPTSTAIIIYTSGTTGPPKGAMISHDNIRASLDGITTSWGVEPGDLMFSFLPLAHAAERICGLYCRINVGLATAFATSLPAVLEEVKEVRPTYFGSVPRIFEKAYARIQGEVEKAPPAKQRVFRWAERVGIETARLQLAGQPVPLALALQQRLADKLVFSKLREVFGGKVRRFVTGAAPIRKQILEFFWGAGFPIYEVYGMTEATCMTHSNRPGALRLESVGRPVTHVEEALADDGEVLIRGRVVFQGYYKDAAATAEAIDADGWLHTGDIGRRDADGFLYIVDRKKHIVITSGGKNLSPANIENELKAEDPLISQVHVHADRRPYVTALVTVSPLEALDWAAANGLAAAAGGTAALEALKRALAENPLARPAGLAELLAQVSASPALRTRLAAAVRRGNRRLSRVEQVQRVHVLERELSPAEDELTPTLKIKRKNVEQKFAATFDRLYEDAGFGIATGDGAREPA